jgi:hypothetical protein
MESVASLPAKQFEFFLAKGTILAAVLLDSYLEVAFLSFSIDK